MIGLGLNATKTPTVNTNIVRDALVLRHDYKDRPVELCSSGAASFDGTDDYVDLGSQSATADMTISAWIFKTDDNANPIIRYGKSLVRIENATHTIRFWADVAGASSSTSNVQENNVWQHWCFTVTGTTANVYKDGVFLESDTVAAVNTATSSSYIGRQSTDYFNGYICNVGVWSAVLTQPQVKSIMNKNYAALSASEKTNLVSWWNLDEETATDGTAGTGGVKDHEGSNHGTLA